MFLLQSQAYMHEENWLFGIAISNKFENPEIIEKIRYTCLVVLPSIAAGKVK